ncbi:MAG TPA: hypothetical protein VFJ71_05960 [Candidatus Limnocylindrales bacterium]|nr:hypothetical protein [Candidatus Limnocylindrales bacterium]
MNRLSTELIDRELGVWLRDESDTRAPAGLVEDVFARTSRMPQARRWWPPVRAARSTGARPWLVGGRPARAAWPRVSAVAGITALLVIGVVLVLGTPRFGPGPGATAPPSVNPSASPSPSLAGPSLPPPPSAGPTVIGGLAAIGIPLGTDAAPIDVTAAFDAIWVANIHAGDVRAYDGATAAEVARIPLGSASWFGITDDGLWVTSQNGTGITRIDPVTKTLAEHVGEVPPCGAPVLALGSLWQAACDGNVFLRIDPETHRQLPSISAQGHGFLVAAGGRLITTGTEGLAVVDPETKTVTSIGGRAAQGAEFIASDGTTVWVKNQNGMARLDPTDGSVIAAFPYLAAQAVTFSGDHAWMTVTGQGVLEIDLATNQVRRTIPVLPSPLVAREAGGALWVTDFEQSQLWRIDL